MNTKEDKTQKTLTVFFELEAKRMDNPQDFFKQFHIGTYVLQPYARTEQHIAELSECGIDLVIGLNYDKPVLDRLHAHGVKAILNGVLPSWFGGTGENAGKMCEYNSEMDYRQAMKGFEDHPAIAAIEMGDEPSSLDFPHYGKIVNLLRECFTNPFLYLNLYPSYGMDADATAAQAKRELGTDSYREYLLAYCNQVDLPYLSFDHYVYSSSPEAFFGDLADAAACCKQYHKKLMVVLQVNSKLEGVFLSLSQLRFQAFSALAYGASVVSWACYCPGWWYHNVLDHQGNKTEQYEKLKTVNHELRALTTEYIQYSWVCTETLSPDTLVTLDCFVNISATIKGLVGLFENREGAKAILFVPHSYEGTGGTLRFTCHEGKAITCRTTSGKCRITPRSDGEYRITQDAPEPLFLWIE